MHTPVYTTFLILAVPEVTEDAEEDGCDCDKVEEGASPSTSGAADEWSKEPGSKRFAKPGVPDEELELRSLAVDYVDRFVGHCNTTTDIKEANFYGK